MHRGTIIKAISFDIHFSVSLFISISDSGPLLPDHPPEKHSRHIFHRVKLFDVALGILPIGFPADDEQVVNDFGVRMPLRKNRYPVDINRIIFVDLPSPLTS